MKRRRALLLCLALSACEGPLQSRPGAIKIATADGATVRWPPFRWWLGNAVAYTTTTDAEASSGYEDVWLARFDGSAPELVGTTSLGDFDVIRDQITGDVHWMAVARTSYYDIGEQVILRSLRGEADVLVDRMQITPWRSEPCETALIDENGAGRLWRGARCDGLRPVAPELAVVSMASSAPPIYRRDLRNDYAAAAFAAARGFPPASEPGHTLVFAKAGGADGTGLHDIAPDGQAVEVVPARLGEYDGVPGLPRPEGLVSNTLVDLGLTWRICPEGRCFLLYNRSEGAGGWDDLARSFVLPLDTRRETALPGQTRYAPAWSTSFPGDARLIAWDEDLGMGGYRHHLWDVLSGQHTSCTSTRGDLVPPELRSFGAGIFVYPGAGSAIRGLTIQSFATGTCISIEHDVLWEESIDLDTVTGIRRFRGAELSPEASRLVWVNSRTELWMAEGNGSNQRLLLARRWFGHPSFAGNEDELLVQWTSFEHGDVLALVNLAGDQPVERRLAEGVFGPWRRSGRKLLAGAGWDPGRNSGELRLIDLDADRSVTLEVDVTAYQTEDGGAVYHVADESPRRGWWARKWP